MYVYIYMYIYVYIYHISSSQFLSIPAPKKDVTLFVTPPRWRGRNEQLPTIFGPIG